MDFKAVISNSGDEKLFKALSSEIERRLPGQAVEWKRSYGRPSKNVVFRVNFVKLDTVLANDLSESASSLTRKPLLHLYWTSCVDSDSFKSWVKGNILRWQQTLKEQDITDWLIVHVLYQDEAKPTKAKIQLPRTTAFDRIKAEFGSRGQESRCVQLWEPDKETLFTKSGESWQALLAQIQGRLLESFSRHLECFEEKVRLLREKYADPDWPFFKYFLVHEELAQIYKSVTLREDALVQYDEVDALLSQFIINCRGKTPPKWLETLCRPASCWDGVNVAGAVCDQYRELIKASAASLLDFRNYLFARQCQLLVKMNRKWEIPGRVLEFLYALVQELKMLQIETVKGSIACWIFLTALHFVQMLETVESEDRDFTVAMAQLCDYARRKYQLLGQVTGLYGTCAQTAEEQALCTILLNGFGRYPCKRDTSSSPVKMLQTALTLRGDYNQVFLSLTNRAMGLYARIGRLRFAMVVGIDLAKFYLLLGEYELAEPHLEKAWSIYRQQKWQGLYTDVLIPLADCQLKHGLHGRYLNSLALLACADSLECELRDFYTREFIRLSLDSSLRLPVISTDPILTINSVHVDLVRAKGHIGDTICVVLELSNHMSIALCAQDVFISLKHSDLHNLSVISVQPAAPKRESLSDDASAVSLSAEKSGATPEEAREPLTPSSLLKRIRSHRRQWSRGRNILKDLGSAASEAKITPSSDVHAIPHPRSASSECIASSLNPPRLAGPDLPSVKSESTLFSEETAGTVVDSMPTLLRLSKSTDCVPALPMDIAKPRAASLNSSSLDRISPSQSLPSEKDGASPVLLDRDGLRNSTILSGRSVDCVIPRDVETVPLDQSNLVEESREVGYASQSILDVAPSETPGDESVCNNDTEVVDGGAASRQLPSESFEHLDEEPQPSSHSPQASSVSTSAVESDPFESLAFEERVDIKMVADKAIQLLPGKNTVKVFARIMDEGRYALQCFSCSIGNINMYKLLALPRQIRSFYVVADPPKILWTTDYIVDFVLSGSRQRLHVTLLNGPGVINEGSILKITSQSGLLFQTVRECTVLIFQLERNSLPREAAISVDVSPDNVASLKLPACRPYERASLHFDVISPVHDFFKQSSHTHTISFECVWLKNLVTTECTLDCIFYEPFQVKNFTWFTPDGMYLDILLRGVNPVALSFWNPSIKPIEQEDLEFTLLSADADMRMYGDEEYHLIWRLSWKKAGDNMPTNCKCVFAIEFKSKGHDEFENGRYACHVDVTLAQCLYEASVQPVEDNVAVCKGKPCSFTLTLVPKTDVACLQGSLYFRIESDVCWGVPTEDSLKQISVSAKDCGTSVSFAAVPLVEGRVSMPTVTLMKLPSATDSDLELTTEELVNSLSRFETGRIIFTSLARTILVHESQVSDV